MSVTVKTPHGFYVYELVDPRDNFAFYVGKGCRRRAWQHEGYVRSGRGTGNEAKDARIWEITQADCNVGVRIIQDCLSEDAAFSLERKLITERRNELTNIAFGGGGVAGSAHLGFTGSLREKRDVLRLCKWLAWAKALPNGVTVPIVKSGDRMGEAIVQAISGVVKDYFEWICDAGGEQCQPT